MHSLHELYGSVPYVPILYIRHCFAQGQPTASLGVPPAWRGRRQLLLARGARTRAWRCARRGGWGCSRGGAAPARLLSRATTQGAAAAAAAAAAPLLSRAVRMQGARATTPSATPAHPRRAVRRTATATTTTTPRWRAARDGALALTYSPSGLQFVIQFQKSP